MNVLLVNLPWIISQDVVGIRAGSRWPMLRKKERHMEYYPFPFSLAYATSALKKNGHNAKIKDCIAENMTENDFFRFVEKNDFDSAVIETSTPSILNDLRFAKMLKEHYGIEIILSGQHATALPEEVMKSNDFVDFILLGGEFETTLPELIDRKKDPSVIDGIAFRKNGKITVNKRRTLITNLDSLEYPERDDLPLEKYNEPFCKFVPNVQMISSRGCPFKCIFCLESQVFYEKSNFRARSPKNVVDEIEYLLAKYKPREIYFDDTSFVVNQEHAQGVCDEIIKRGLDINWSCMGDAMANEETLRKMKKSGCVGIKFGLESANPQILKNIRKHVNVEYVKKFVGLCRKYKIATHATYMFGLPGENKDTINSTLEFASKLGTDTAQFSIATPYPGTDFFKMCKENGWLVTEDWSKFNGESHVVINYPDCNNKMIEEALVKANKMLIWNIIKNPKLFMRYSTSIFGYYGFTKSLKFFIEKAKFLTE